MEHFLDHYAPCQVEKNVLNACINQILLGSNSTLIGDEHGYRWTDLRDLSTNGGIPGSKMFEPLKKIVVSVMDQKQNGLRINHSLVPHVTSEVPVSTHVIDAWFIEGVCMGPSPKHTETRAPEEVEKYKTKLSRRTLGRSHVRRSVLLSKLS